jgi:NodT family efflux transporter outer membrane factor (OMF) lipoprotein
MTDTRGDRGWNEGYELSLTASYEADIWGRVKSRTEAGRYEIQAGKYDLETLYISLSAEMAERYYLYQYLIKQREYLKGQLKLKTDQLEARERMYEYGIGSVETVYNSRKAISDIQDSINENEKNIKDAKLEIAKLLGHSSSSGINLKSSPLTVPELPKAIPSDVVKNRPDIQSAFSTVMKIDRNAAEAVANRYPKLSLSASAAYNGDEIRNLITPDNFVANILANLVMPVFDANSRKLEAERQKTLLAQQIYRYQDTVIGALKEVESALLENIQKEKALINSNEKKEIDKKLLAVSKMRYELGVKKYENVIDSQVDKISGEIAFIKARRDLISSRIGLIRAIGGSWASDNITERLASKENGE